MFVCVCVRTSAVSTIKTLSSQRRRATFSDRRLPRSASSAVCSQIKDGIVLRTVAPCQVCFCSCFVCFGLVCVCLRTCVFLCAHSLCVDGARMCFCVRTLLCLSSLQRCFTQFSKTRENTDRLCLCDTFACFDLCLVALLLARTSMCVRVFMCTLCLRFDHCVHSTWH